MALPSERMATSMGKAMFVANWVTVPVSGSIMRITPPGVPSAFEPVPQKSMKKNLPWYCEAQPPPLAG